MDEKKKGLTYAEAGVDIDAGEREVELIKKSVQATYTRGVLGDLGGFGGLFRLKDELSEDPILVSGTDGVGTKLRLAIEMGIHHTIGQDCVAMSVNDVLVQGARPLFFLDYFLYKIRSDRKEVNLICHSFGCLYGSNIRIDKNGFNPFFFQGFECLRTGIVKLSGLTNLERTRTQDKHFL